MKNKIISVLFGLVVVLSFSMTKAAPALADGQSTLFSPEYGTEGTSITVSGSGWGTPDTINDVTVGGIPATNYSLSVDSDGRLLGTITVPHHVTGGWQDIVITGSNSGTHTFSNVFIVQTAIFSPDSGPVGTSITVTGDGWMAYELINHTTGVTIGGIPATNTILVDNSDNTLGHMSCTITVPLVGIGTQDITIVGAATGAHTFPGAFTVTDAPSIAADILTYSLSGETGIIDNIKNTIDVTVPDGTDVTNLVATFTTSANISSIKVGLNDQKSDNTPNDFTTPVTYTITAADDTVTKTYTVTVTTMTATNIDVPGDYPSIQSAIDAAVPGNTIHVAAGTYNENITLKNGVEVLGAGHLVTTIKGTGSGSVVMASNVGSATKLEGFTITNGSAIYGGGMYNDSSSPTVTDCIFSGNSATIYGGGMLNNSSSPTVTDCTFSGNSTICGGGMYNDSSSPTVKNCIFSDNSATHACGGMYNFSSSPTVTNCTFSGNSAPYSGGMVNGYNSSTTVTNCTFSGNSATTYGGGMLNYASSTTVTHCIFSGNSASYGGGMMNQDNDSTMVTNCTFSGNSASYGGGMLNENNSSTTSPTVTNCIFSGNSATTYGGGMLNNTSSTKVTNCIFSGNSATNDGGGMGNYYNDSTTVTNCTFYGNSASDGGGMYNFASWPTVTNCILWDGGGEISNDQSSPGVTYCDIQGGFSGTGNISGDPLFVNPSANDYHLQSSSPCIDKGYNSAPSLPGTDFEGDPRIVAGNVDMGADEYVPPDAARSTLTPTSSSITANGTSTQVLTVTAKDANGNALTSGGATVTITQSSGTGTISTVTDNSNGTYTATVTSPTASGSAVFVATLGGNPVESGTGSQTQATVNYIAVVVYIPAPVVTTTTTTTQPGNLTGKIDSSTGDFTAPVTVPSADNEANVSIDSGVTGTINGAPLSQITVAQVADPEATPNSNANFRIGDVFYNFGPNGAQFSSPVALILPYDPNLGPNAFIAYWDTTANPPAWTTLSPPFTIDAVHNTITGHTTHFTVFSVLAPAIKPASFSFSNLSVTPSEVASGQNVIITATVTNSGDLSGRYSDQLLINGTVISTMSDSLAGNQSQTIGFSVDENTAGTYNVVLGNLNGSFSVKPAEAVTTPASPITPTTTAPSTTLQPTTTTPTPTPSNTSPVSTKSTSSIGWIFIVIGVVVVIALAVGFVLFRKRSNGN